MAYGLDGPVEDRWAAQLQRLSQLQRCNELSDYDHPAPLVTPTSEIGWQRLSRQEPFFFTPDSSRKFPSLWRAELRHYTQSKRGALKQKSSATHESSNEGFAKHQQHSPQKREPLLASHSQPGDGWGRPDLQITCGFESTLRQYDASHDASGPNQQRTLLAEAVHQQRLVAARRRREHQSQRKHGQDTAMESVSGFTHRSRDVCRVRAAGVPSLCSTISAMSDSASQIDVASFLPDQVSAASKTYDTRVLVSGQELLERCAELLSDMEHTLDPTDPMQHTELLEAGEAIQQTESSQHACQAGSAELLSERCAELLNEMEQTLDPTASAQHTGLEAAEAIQQTEPPPHAWQAGSAASPEAPPRTPFLWFDLLLSQAESREV
jgi:hypothetical protein